MTYINISYIITYIYTYTYVILYTYYNLNVHNIIPVLIAVIVAVDGGLATPRLDVSPRLLAAPRSSANQQCSQPWPMAVVSDVGDLNHDGFFYV